MPGRVIWNPSGEGDFFVAVDGRWRRRAQEAGFDRHLTKPVDFDTLASLLDRVPRRAR